jgi:capsular exopolysaccharide synthesis family protein
MNEATKNSQDLNVVDLFFYLLSKWRWFLLSMLVFGGLAWYMYAIKPFQYFRQATVIIKDPSNKTVTAGFDRYENYINKVNVANEILQFRSKKLMQDVVQRVHADVNYHYMDGLRKNELYNKTPVKVSFVDAPSEAYLSFSMTVLDKEQVSITEFGDETNDESQQVAMNDTVVINGWRMVFVPTPYCKESWFGKDINVQKVPLASMAAYYLGNLGIRQETEEASILTLSLKDNSASRAEDVLNMLISVYNDYAIRDKNQVAVNTANFINERLVIIGQELGGVETELENFKRKNLIIDIGSTAGSFMTDARESNSEVLEMETQIRMARYIKEYLEDANHLDDLIPSNTGVNDNVETQINQYNAIKLRRDKLVEDSSDKNPVVEELNNSLHAMRQSIIRAIDNMIAQMQVRRDDAMEQGIKAQNQVSVIPTKEREMLSIERQQKIKESLYLFLLNRREENALSQAMADNNARIIDGASGSNLPIEPNRNRILLVGLLVGFFIPAVIFLFRMFVDTFVHSRRDLKGKVSAPFLGEIPFDKFQLKKGAKSDIIVSANDGDIVSEAFRILRTNIEFMGKKERKNQVLMFTSFNEGAGKTFISRNLAMSFVYAKKRVLLLDTDIRKGTLSRYFPKQPIGLTNYLADESIGVENIIYQIDGVENLDYIPAGTIAPNPAELLMDSRLDDLLVELRKRYDYIIADNVPVGVVADAAIANRIADQTIFVVRAGKLDRRQLPDIENLYQEKTLNNLSLVLNAVDMKRHGYGYGYGYGRYGYGRYGYVKKN